MTQQHGSTPGPGQSRQPGAGTSGKPPREPRYEAGSRPGSEAGPGEQAARLEEEAAALGTKAAGKAKAEVERQGRKAADQADRLADTIEQAASNLREQGSPELSEYVSRLADGIGEVADSLRSKSVDDLLRDLRGMAERNPAMLIAGSIAVGFGITRFARASAGGPTPSPFEQAQQTHRAEWPERSAAAAHSRDGASGSGATAAPRAPDPGTTDRSARSPGAPPQSGGMK
jgi:hypothetical protein